MTRQQQNNAIITKFIDKLADMPNVQDVIEKAYTDWFQSLVKAGIAQMQQQTAAGPPAGGGAAPQGAE